MGRLACLSVPALPLQLLLRLHPDWQDHPTAVVAEEKSRGAILYVNRAAARAGVRPGWRYGAGLSLVSGLRAGVVAEETVAAEVARLAERLQRFTPQVEPSPTQAGVFWLGAAGLRRVSPSLQAWAAAVLAAVREAGFEAALVVGFSRFGSYAVARTQSHVAECGATVFAAASGEREAVRRVLLARLSLAPEAGERLAQLGIRTVGEFAALPEAGILERFGAPAQQLHRMARGVLGDGMASGAPASGRQARLPREHPLPLESQPPLVPLPLESQLPLVPLPLLEPAAQTILLEYPEADLTALLFLIKSRLHPLLGVLAQRRQGLAGLELRLKLEGRPEGRLEGDGQRLERVRPAAPTLDAALILELVRLRLEGVTLAQGVVAVGLLALGGPAPPEQLRLFSEHPRRDLRAGEQALARLRAEFGEQATVRAELKDGHLPEAQFAWVPLERMAFPARGVGSGTAARDAGSGGPSRRAAEEPVAGQADAGTGVRTGVRTLVRRLYPKARALPSPERNGRDGTFVGGQVRGPIARRLGPYLISGGWWVREVRRDYYFAETAQGEVLWLYYDRRRRQWFLQGRVE